MEKGAMQVTLGMYFAMAAVENRDATRPINLAGQGRQVWDLRESLQCGHRFLGAAMFAKILVRTIKLCAVRRCQPQYKSCSKALRSCRLL